MNLQEDEVEFANPLFKQVYEDLVERFLQDDNFDNKNYLNNLNQEHSQLVSDIFMDDEKYQLHAWFEKKQVFVKDKTNTENLTRLVNETIIAYREYLINKLSSALMQEIMLPEIEDKSLLQEELLCISPVNVPSRSLLLILKLAVKRSSNV